VTGVITKTRRASRIAALAVSIAGLMVGTAQTGLAGPLSDFEGAVNSGFCAVQPARVDVTPSGSSLAGRRKWGFEMHTHLALGAPTPSVTVNSGFAPATLLSQPPFTPCSGVRLSSLPYVVAQSGLNPGTDCICPTLTEAPRGTDLVGFASSRSVTPLRIPVAGTDQVEGATFQVTDPSLAGLLKLNINSPVPGATYVSASPPAGATVIPTGGGVQFALNPVLGQSYTFSVTLHVPNPVGRTFISKPQYDFALLGSGSSSNDPGPATSETILVPSLDGTTPGAGSATFAVGGAGGSWSLGISASSELVYLPTGLPQPCDGQHVCGNPTEGD
jgi:hypothetical protein